MKDKRDIILEFHSSPDAILNALHQAGWKVVPKASPVGERSEPSVKDKVWSKIVTETGDMERADRVTSGKDTPSTFELLRPDQPPSSAKATDDKQEWTPNQLRFVWEHSGWTGLAVKVNAELATERQRNFDAEKEIRDKARARIEELKSDLLSALAAIEKHNEDQLRNMLPDFVDVDLSALREHDEKLTAEVRKPMVDALKLAKESLDYDGQDLQPHAFEVVSDALAKAKQ